MKVLTRLAAVCVLGGCGEVGIVGGVSGDSVGMNKDDDECEENTASCEHPLGIAAGYQHTCGFGADGRAFCWGAGGFGQLGNSGGSGSQVPVLVDVSGISPPVSFTAITAGYWHTCGLTTDGRAFCWGVDVSGQLGNGDGVLSSCINLLCSRTPIPVDVSGISPPVSFKALAAGYEHTCGLTTDDRAFCWGDGEYGKLGSLPPRDCGSERCSLSPVPVDGYFKSITAGYEHTCGLAANGIAYCWGNDADGQLGNGDGFGGSSNPSRVETGVVLTFLTAGSWHTCGLATDGSAYCWGDDVWSQLGDGKGAPNTCFAGMYPCSQSPVPVAGGISFTLLTAGDRHTCGLATDGRAFCWGLDGNGQLGNGAGAPSTCTYGSHDYPCSESPFPVDMSGISPPVSFVALEAGQNHTCGLADDGRVFCWGRDDYGQLGNGAGGGSEVPVLVDSSGIH